MEESPIKESFGVVVLLDALGVRQYGLDDSTAFLKNFKSFQTIQKEMKEKALNEHKGKYGIKGEINV